MDSLDQARQILEQLVRDYPNVPGYRLDLAISLREIGLLRFDPKRPDVGQSERNSARGQLQDLATEFPDQPDYQAALEETINLFEQLIEGL